MSPNQLSIFFLCVLLALSMLVAKKVAGTMFHTLWRWLGEAKGGDGLSPISQHSPDNPQIQGNRTSVPPPRGDCIPFPAIRWPDFGDRPSFGRPFAQIFRHSATLLLSFSPGCRLPRPTPERVFVVDHQSGSGFSGTGSGARRLRPIGT